MQYVYTGGTWNTCRYVSVYWSGGWKQLVGIYVGVSGTWRATWTYWWATGAWGGCSRSCAGGTQTRTVTCMRNSGSLPDAWCTKMAGAKPATSQVCNTQDCPTECNISNSRPFYKWTDCSATNGTVQVSWGGTNNIYNGGAVSSVASGGYLYTRGSLWASEGYTCPIYQVCRRVI